MIRHVRQLLAFLLFPAFIVLFANGPEYRLLAPQEAIVSITFSHAGQRVGECRKLSQEELNELPPNMRKPNDCPRERHPVQIRLAAFTENSADEKLLLEETLLPSGMWSDGKANIYRRLTMPAGKYRFKVGMKDSGGEYDFDYEQIANVTLTPGQNLVIHFDELQRTFTFE